MVECRDFFFFIHFASTDFFAIFCDGSNTIHKKIFTFRSRQQETFIKGKPWFVKISDFGFVFQRPRTPSLDEIFEKIREAVHKNGIRTTEFFKDHDKLRSGEITENQARIN